LTALVFGLEANHFLTTLLLIGSNIFKRFGISSPRLAIGVFFLLQLINDIGGEKIMNRFEPNNGEHIGELIHQERVRELRNSL